MAVQAMGSGGGHEAKIPVFAVLKKGSILKNIFLNKPPPELLSAAGLLEGGSPEEAAAQEEEKILIGRHPDCHIALDHPSISRFHVELRVRPASQKLSVVDLSSVHGTWVSGSKIEPRVAVDLVEGDTVRLGASTRVYELHWVPLSRAFDWSMPLPTLEEEQEQEQGQQAENGVPSVDDFSFQPWANQIPSAPAMPQSIDSPFSSPAQPAEEARNPGAGAVDEIVVSCAPRLLLGFLDPPSPLKAAGSSDGGGEACLKSPCPPKSGKSVASSLLSRRSKSISFLRVQTGKSSEKSGASDLGADEQRQNATEFEQAGREEPPRKVLFPEGEEEEVDEEAFFSDKENTTPAMSGGTGLKKNGTCSPRSALSVDAVLEEKEDGFFSDKENCTPRVSRSHGGVLRIAEKSIGGRKMCISKQMNCGQNLEKNQVGSLRSAFSIEAAPDHQNKAEFFPDKENCTPRSLDSAGAPVLGTAEDGPKSDGKKGVPTEENSREQMDKNQQVEVQISALNIDSSLDDIMEDAFLSDKENCTPHVSRSAGKVSAAAGSHEKSGEQGRSSRVASQASEKDGSPARRRMIEGEIMRKRSGRVPFRSLFEIPVGKSSPAVARIPLQPLADKLSACATCSHHLQKSTPKINTFSSKSEAENLRSRTWNMVADTSCFLSEESNKALQLLEGLRGTQLIIPRTVVRELDCLRQREGFFRKSSPRASSALQWIHGCMVKTGWWIHVQSSTETAAAVAPTPPATPRVQPPRDESSPRSLAEILSPTAEDHILDCALLFRKIKKDGQLVLLTGEVSLRIKAMAEGLLCETPKEFRESLVNPLSERFMWAESSPRGQTWSLSDRAAGEEDSSTCLLLQNTRKAAGTTRGAAETAKGLKLILLHNSHYAQSSFIR